MKKAGIMFAIGGKLETCLEYGMLYRTLAIHDRATSTRILMSRMEVMTTNPSIMFQPLCKYVCEPKIKPLAMIFITISAEKGR